MRILLLLCISLVFPSFCHAEKSKELLDRFDGRFQTLDSMIFATPEALAPERDGMPADKQEAEALRDSLIGEKTSAEIRALNSRTGLQLSGQIYYRPGGSASGNDADDALSRYNGKVQAELRWYFFQSSLFRREANANEVRIKGEIERVASAKERLGVLLARQREAFRQRHDSLLCGVLRHRVLNLELLGDANLYLLEHENISSDELLGILNEKAEAERMLASIPCDGKPCEAFPYASVLLVEVDTARFMQEIRERHSDLALLQLNMELLEQRRQNTLYWNDFRLAPFVRYSYYTRPEMSNSSNIDAGISFTVPLSAEAGKKRKAIEAERRVLALQRDAAESRIADEIRLILEDVERYNRLIAGEVKRAGELRSYIGMRTDAYRNRIGEYSRLARLKEYNAYLSCWESMLGYQYARNLRLADLQAFLADTPVADFCRAEQTFY